MKLPKSKRKLEEIYQDETRDTKIRELEGEYAVEMLTWPFSKLPFPDRKIFLQDQGRVTGHNVLYVLFKNWKWGYFFLREVICPKTDLGVVEINYNTGKNLVSGRMRDHVRRVEDGLYLGRFHIEIWGKLIFLGYFSLTKKQ